MSKKSELHESLEERTEVRLGSERSLGVVFAIVFLVIGLWPLLGSHPPRAWSLGIAAAFVLLGLLAPRTLTPLNRLWFRFGMLLHKVVSPVVMALIFCLTVVPTGLLLRLFRRDPLRLKYDPEASSYWIMRQPPGPPPDSFNNQF